jgi:CPA1 family monovalent cation:H+ antiporter
LVAFQVVAILVTLAAVFAYLNDRYLRLHPTVGVMLLTIIAAVTWMGVAHFWPAASGISADFRQHVDLNAAVFHWMLGPLLFAGALHVDWAELRSQRTHVTVLAVLGTLLSTAAVTAAAYGLGRLFGLGLPLQACALFGAIISPTDPVAVLGFMKMIHSPRDIEAVIAGESLFNDGVGVVLFGVLVGGAQLHSSSIWWTESLEFLKQTAGGAGVGLAAGALGLYMVRRVRNFQVEVMVTIAVALGGYALADALTVSGPIAAVVAGLLIGNRGNKSGLPAETRMHVGDFWELVDETLNAVLFLLVGLVALESHAWGSVIAIQLIAILIALTARWISVLVSTAAADLVSPKQNRFKKGTVTLLTWGGLRGGLAVAMVLSLSPGPARDLLVPAVYGVVVFSVLVQGTTLPWLFRRWMQKVSSGSSWSIHDILT